MIHSKEEFLRSFLPPKVKDMDFVHINLDITDLSVSDILRNLHKSYPPNSRTRNAIISGNMVIAILCKTETIEPLKGLFLIIANDDLQFEIYSSNYVVLCISEENIRSDEAIADTINKITGYLADNFSDQIYNLADFYRKFIYDPYEMEDDYETPDGFYL